MEDFLLSEEAQKYCKLFKDKIFIVKYGGAVLRSDKLMPFFLKNIAFMVKKGIRIVLVHGGGPHLSQKMQEHAIKVQFVNGMRVTTPETIKLAQEVFKSLNEQICRLLRKEDVLSISYTKGENISARLLDPLTLNNRVGLVDKINIPLPSVEEIPVVSSLGIMSAVSDHEQDMLLNLNADHLAVELGIHFKASKIIFISDVDGIYLDTKDSSTKLLHVDEDQIQELIDKQILRGGMKVKIQMALVALRNGVDKIHFIDGSNESSILQEVFTDQGVGTEIIHA